jgi:hypothetical protein
MQTHVPQTHEHDARLEANPTQSVQGFRAPASREILLGGNQHGREEKSQEEKEVT